MSLKDIGKRAAMLAEREAILVMLQRTAWNKRKAANKLRISYKALLYKMRQFNLDTPRTRRSAAAAPAAAEEVAPVGAIRNS